MSLSRSDLGTLLFESEYPSSVSTSVDNDAAAVESCLNNLGQIGLHGISGEARRLSRERDVVLRATQDLAFTNYKTFIQTAHCSKEIAAEFAHTQESLDRLERDRLPDLRASLRKFAGEADDLTAHRRLTSALLARHTKLLEVLELPQLAETCVRNGHYDEALELQQFAARLERKKLGRDIPVVAEVLKAVRGSAKLMLAQLLAQLREPLGLPACLRAVAHLRRMNLFDDTQLRLSFLRARQTWLAGVLAAVPKDDAYTHLSRTIELTRVHLFDIVTQYRALFADDDPLVPLAAAAAAKAAAVPQSSHRLLFSAWLSARVAAFLLTLQQDLDAGAGAQSIDAIIGQAMYFGQSLGRVGADFRLCMATIFTKALQKASLSHLHSADIAFAAGMTRLVFRASASPAAAGVAGGGGSGDADPLQPPQTLMEFAPLAELCNAVLSSLNELRLCAPLSLAPDLVRHVQAVLESASATIVTQANKFSKTSVETERRSFCRLVALFAKDLVPYLDRCLRALFSPMQVAATLSLAQADLSTTLRLDPIVSPLKHLLPSRSSIPAVAADRDAALPPPPPPARAAPACSDAAAAAAVVTTDPPDGAAGRTKYVADRKGEIADAVREITENEAKSDADMEKNVDSSLSGDCPETQVAKLCNNTDENTIDEIN